MAQQPYHEFDRTRWLTGPLAIFDLGLGVLALFFPRVYLELLQPGAVHGPTYMLGRTAIIWIGFCLAETIAFFFYRLLPEWVLIVAVMRVDDVPADLYYRFADHSLGNFGKWTLLLTPLINTIAAIALFVLYFRARRRWLVDIEEEGRAMAAR